MAGFRNLVQKYRTVPETLLRVRGFIPAFASFAIALAFHWVFHYFFGTNFPGIFFVYLLSLLFAAWCGYVPGLAIVLLIATIPNFLFRKNFTYADISGSGVLVLSIVSAMVSRTAQWRRESEAILRNMNEELSRRVQEKTLELAEANAALERRLTELLRANADLEQFAYSASHDLLEPLRMVSIFTQMLQKEYGGKLDAQADEYIGHAVAGARRMETLIRGLRSYMSIASTGEPPPLSDAGSVLRRCLQTLQPAIAECHGRVESGPLPAVPVHEVHLEQLLQNLIGNALKYRGEDTPVIRIWAERDHSAWVFAVRDNGIGIDKAYAGQIFGVFKRLHRNDEYDGAGIGLAICHRIVERYGGRIWVESTLGQGSTFYFSLPGERERLPQPADPAG
jgi:light-regulated signal transduction histidine kinase (bacteriophytochrome)